MRLGIMQPYFFPYLGYFQLMQNVDKWIFFDSVQFTKKSWITRNRILKPEQGWQYIRMPVKNYSSKFNIAEVEVDYSREWEDLIIRQLEHYKKIAPYYDEVIHFLNSCLFERYKTITEANAFFIKKVFEFLELPFSYRIYSAMDIEIGDINHPGDWALEISKALQATAYVNPPGGKEIFSPEKFSKNGIKLEFIQPNLTPYKQGHRPFIEGLSILDLMMFLDKKKIKERLTDYSIERAN